MFFSKEYKIELSKVQLQEMFLIYLNFCNRTNQNLLYTEEEFNKMLSEDFVPSEFIDSLVYHYEMNKNI